MLDMLGRAKWYVVDSGSRFERPLNPVPPFLLLLGMLGQSGEGMRVKTQSSSMSRVFLR